MTSDKKTQKLLKRIRSGHEQEIKMLAVINLHLVSSAIHPFL